MAIDFGGSSDSVSSVAVQIDGKNVEMLTLDSATTQTGIYTSEILRLIENDEIHSAETKNGHLIICKD